MSDAADSKSGCEELPAPSIPRQRAMLAWLQCAYRHPVGELLFPGGMWALTCGAMFLPETPRIIAGAILLGLGIWGVIRMPSVPRKASAADWRLLIETVNDNYQAAVCTTSPGQKSPDPVVQESVVNRLREELAQVRPLTAEEDAALDRYQQRKDVHQPCIAFEGDRLPSSKHYLEIECAALLGQVMACFLLLILGASAGLFAEYGRFVFYATSCIFISLLSFWILLRSHERNRFVRKRCDSDELFWRTHRLYKRKFLDQCDCWKKWGSRNALSSQVTPEELRYHEGLAQEGQEDALQKLRDYAGRGSAEAMFAMGNLYYRGYPNTPQDIPAAVGWFVKAAECDHLEALNTLGWIYHHGFGDVKKDIALALKYWEKAANLGSVSAQRKIALLYENGNGVSKDIAMAISWYKKAAEQNDDKSLYNLGCIYFRGNDVAKNIDKALQYFRQADALGNELAHNMIKWMY